MFKNAKFKGAPYNKETELPKGFNPVKVGMVKVEE
jgi:hypothetical protein